MVKMYLHQDLSDLVRDHPHAHVSAYVDDITLEVRLADLLELGVATIDAMKQFKNITHKLKLTLSTKGQILSKSIN